MGEMWYLIWCLECSPEPTAYNPQPFTDPAERGKWAAAHTKGTGHEIWKVLDFESQRTGQGIYRYGSSYDQVREL